MSLSNENYLGQAMTLGHVKVTCHVIFQTVWFPVIGDRAAILFGHVKTICSCCEDVLIFHRITNNVDQYQCLLQLDSVERLYFHYK